MSVIKCCRDCDQRYHACHDVCQEYIKEKTESLEARIARMKEQQVDYNLSQMKKGKGKRKKK